MDIQKLIDRIEDLLNRIKEIDRRQKRRIRELEGAVEYALPPLVPGSGRIADKE